jgi:hypothetical protein
MKARDIERLLTQQPTASPPAELADRIKAEIPEHLEVAPELLNEPAEVSSRQRVWRMLKVAAVVMPLLLTVLVGRHLVDRYDSFEQTLVATQADRPDQPRPPAEVSPGESAVAEEQPSPAPQPTLPADTHSQTTPNTGVGTEHESLKAKTGQIKARVSWQGEPLQGVTIFVDGETEHSRKTAFSNNIGEARIPFLPEGEYTLRAEMDTFEPQMAQLRVNKKQVASVDIQMVACPVKERMAVTSSYETVSSPSPLLASNDIRELEELPVGRDIASDEIFVSGSQFAGLALERKMPTAFNGVKKDQPATWKRSQLVTNTSRLMIGDREELSLRGLQAEVAIDGFRARVVLDLYFFNDHDRRVEGTFKLRLPDNASPYYFAFGEEQVVRGLPPDRPSFQTDRSQPGQLSPGDLARQRKQRWHNVKEARMVPKEQAAHAYTETVRGRIDPALVEWSGAGIYSARVYPLAPRRLHRIVIGYDVDLLEVDGNLEYRLDLPADMVKRSVDISVAELGDRPILITPEVEGDTSSGRRRYQLQQDDLRTVTVRIPAPGNIFIADQYDQAGPLFAARLRPELPEASASDAATDAIFLVDTSLSSSPDRFAIWMRLLPAILEQSRDTIKRFAVLFFSVDSHWWQTDMVRNRAGNVEQLLHDSEDLLLEGASDLAAALSEAGRPGPEGLAAGSRPRTIFLLSDGHATWGERDLARAAARLDAPIFAYRTGLAGTDTSSLAAVARASGGAVFSVIGDSEISSAAIAHRNRSWQIEGIELAGCSDLMLAGRPSDLYPGQTVMLAGRGTPEPGSMVKLHLSRDGKQQTLSLAANHLLRSALATRTYGNIATGQLESFAHLTEQYSRAYARHFRVPGRTCSLLMLDSEADYQRFNIKPGEDAYIVKTTAVTKLVPATVAAGGSLPDQRQAFDAWLQRLQQMPGVNLQVPAFLQVAVQQMPERSFTIRPQPLRCQVRRLDQIPPQLTEILLPDQVDYDLLSAEAERRLVEHGADDALKALSSLVEANPGDPVLVRDLALSAVGWGLGGHAHSLLQRVIEARPAEPHSYHQMARVLTELGNTELALVYYELCLAAKWDRRFGDLHRIIGLDYLRFLRRIAAGELQTGVTDLAATRLDRLGQQHNLSSADLLVVITWNTDRTDVDLRVTEPTGEECSYSNTATRIGGNLSKDVTDGYGPEMYLLPRAVAGTYHVRANYYASDRNRASARSKVYTTIYEAWGTPEERVSHKVLTLTQGKETVDIATVKVSSR